jgi:peptidoglycan/xylan/chitin deacetylase (PgdA/CDA1 family)
MRDETSEVLPTGPRRFEWREGIAQGLYHSGLLRLMQSFSRSFQLQFVQGSSWPRWQRATTPKYVILCYHRVGTGGVPFYSELSKELFEAQMAYLKERFRLLSLEEVRRGLQDSAGLQDPAAADFGVAVTFDDGYRGVFENAFPILQKYQIPATVFLTVDSIETGQVAWYDRIFLILQVLPAGRLELELDRLRHFELSSREARIVTALEIMSLLRTLPDWRRRECCADLEKRVRLPQEELADRMLNWHQVQTMQRAGISFGSHTMTHPVVSRLTPAEMEKELIESKRILETKLDCPVLDFAFPFGKLEECGLEITSPMMSRCGYRSAATTELGVNTRAMNTFALYRAQIGGERNLAMFAFRLHQLFLFADSASPPVNSKPGISSDGKSESGRSRILEGTRNA